MDRRRLKRIFDKIGNDNIFTIEAYICESEFHRQNINPYFLYFTKLPIDKIILDSILEINKLELVLYADPDPKLGMEYGDIGIKVKPLKMLKKKVEMGEEVKKKIDELRVIKEKWEIKQIKNAVEITLNGFKKMKNFIKNNKKINESNLEGIFYQELINNNCVYAYPPIIGSGKNAAYIHYNLNNKNILTKDLILMDCGAKNQFGYCADITETVLPKNPTKYQRIVYRIVEKAFENCYNSLRTRNVSIKDLDNICKKTFMEMFGELKLKNNKKWNDFLDSEESLKILYPHFIGHQVGLDVHDPSSIKLGRNMVFTIEPGLYFPENYKIIPKEYRQVGGVRIERMILMGTKPEIMC